MNSARRYKILSRFIKVVIFLISVVAFGVLFKIINPYLLELISKFTQDNSEKIQKIVSIVSVLLNLILSAVIQKIVENKFFPSENVPEVFITSRTSNPNNLSGIKLAPNILKSTYISIGEKQPQCRFVYAKIKNTGTSVIAACLINKQGTGLTLEPDQESDLTIVVYEPISAVHGIRIYDFIYQVQDLDGNVYEGEYRLQIDKSLTQSTFLPRKKLKRRVLKNALSDM